jgi:16S rRNA (adenine1518-N6/adenine1519-N6)-dimethyltransferase
MKILEQPSVVVRDKTAFDLIVKTAFSHRRKMLSNALRNLRDDSKALLSKAGIDGSRRPETLSIEEYAHLADVMTN